MHGLHSFGQGIRASRSARLQDMGSYLGPYKK